jgi:flavin reductase (DIM6/NTAB) family NADH-FMN oxidoreductase RutF
VPARQIDITALDPALAYKVLVGAVQPRPIAWVSTVAADGTTNLAPFSFFTVASREPATLLVSIGPQADGGVKDTLANVRATGDFVVNVASFDHRLAVSATGATVAPEIDEFALAQLTAVPSDLVQAPRVAEARLSVECRLRQEHQIGTDTVIYGTVLRVHAADGVLDDALRVDNDVLNPLGRLAGPWFSGPLSSIPESGQPAATVTRG